MLRNATTIPNLCRASRPRRGTSSLSPSLRSCASSSPETTRCAPPPPPAAAAAAAAAARRRRRRRAAVAARRPPAHPPADRRPPALQVLTDACWALSYLSEPPERVQPVIDAGVVPRLVEHGAHELLVQTPALRTVGNICAQEAEQTQAVLDCGALPRLGALLHSPKNAKGRVGPCRTPRRGRRRRWRRRVAGLVPRLVELRARRSTR